MEQRLSKDENTVKETRGSYIRTSTGFTEAVSGAARERANIRIDNNRRILRRHMKELEKLPPCAGSTPSIAGVYLGGGLGSSSARGAWTTTDVISLGGRDPTVDAIKYIAASHVAYWTYIGYRFLHFSTWEADLKADWAYYNVFFDPGIPGTGAIGSAAVRANDSVGVRAQWAAGLRLRGGYYVTPTTQLYLAAGPSWLRTEASLNCTVAGVCGTNGIPAFSQTNSDTKLGWTIGAGVETVLSGNWRGRAEYRYADYQSFSTGFGTPNALAVSSNVNLHMHNVMFGVSYSFGDPTASIPVSLPIVRK